jgi:hypothetical protein
MNTNETKEDGFIIIPREWMQVLSEKQDKIISLLEKGSHANTEDCIGDYVSEEEAKRQLGRKTTWFWNLRTAGELPFSKVGKKIFYLKSDIKLLIDRNMKKDPNHEARPILSKAA